MKVLLGIGGSDDSVRALERVVERTAETGDDLTIAVLENPSSDRSPADIEERAYEALSGAGLPVADRDSAESVPDAPPVVVRHLAGEPGPRLVEVADREGFDRIVLGGGQRSPMGKIAIGDIAEFVLLNARTSVTLIR